MPERGPSGTGHERPATDGEGMPTEREWLEGAADPPVAVPGPASVSPAEPRQPNNKEWSWIR